MNSKCRKSNLVAHRYILLFAYLPAPVFSCSISGLGISNMQRYAYVFFLVSFISFAILLFFCLLYITALSVSSFCPRRLPSTLCIPSLQVSLRYQGVPFSPPPPPAGCMTGEQVERRANDKSPSLHLSLTFLPTVLPQAVLTHPSSFLPLQQLPILSAHIDIQMCPGCIPPSLKVSPNHHKKVGLTSQPGY